MPAGLPILCHPNFLRAGSDGATSSVSAPQRVVIGAQPAAAATAAALAASTTSPTAAAARTTKPLTTSTLTLSPSSKS